MAGIWGAVGAVIALVGLGSHSSSLLLEAALSLLSPLQVKRQGKGHEGQFLVEGTRTE